MAEDEVVDQILPEFPTGRVKKIMKLDKDINKVNSEALFLISCSTNLFLQLLAERSAEVAAEKKKKTVKLDHLRTGVKRHRPTSDFLLDSLPVPAESTQPVANSVSDRDLSRPVADKPAPAGTRRIDNFFRKPENDAPVQINDI
ncbi:enhancer of yellow 2 transcription factor-like protein [Hibiscus syriacus]|uniref:Enhancer of yellow 2 transcription factor-like protein n=1 Tax=Hibiscus syriacus TaxID=106335 RepID=A0A6A3BHV6_HIBSY|nr:nuclear transcription factor Y subunit C-5 [Hibiscus syriacus]KAE8716606.1 enhancer of yellow 2 transcription factor-like protein [Hibiscus syriacus]